MDEGSYRNIPVAFLDLERAMRFLTLSCDEQSGLNGWGESIMGREKAYLRQMTRPDRLHTTRASGERWWALRGDDST